MQSCKELQCMLGSSTVNPSVVTHDHDWQPATHRTPYTNHGERLGQRRTDTLVDRLALGRGGLCGLEV